MSRIFGRQFSRLKRLIARRRLARAETELGVLGWQQADFEGEAQRHVEQLADFERAQVRLTNESAAQALALRELHEERGRARRLFDEARVRLEAERAKVAGPVAETERQLAARQRMLEDFADRLTVLERELREVRQLHSELLAFTPQTAETRSEMFRLRARMVAIPSETSGLSSRQQQAAQEIRVLEESVARERTALAAVDERRRAQQAEFAEADGARDKELADREREKRAADKENDALEKAKGNPHRKLGQLLADSGIAPMNQPHALAAVELGRDEVARLDAAIATSLDESASEDRATLRKSWLLLAAVALAVVPVAWCVFR